MPNEPMVPPEPYRSDGAPRRVGIEIEFAGLSIDDGARLVRALFGGREDRLDEHRLRVKGTEIGDFRIELDMSLAHPDRPETPEAGLLEQAEQKVRAAIGEAGSLFLPFEIACPPVPIAEIGRIDRLVAALRAAGAQGTEGRFFYAFGLHFNPEPARIAAGPIIDTVKAYLLLSPLLRRDMGIDFARRLAPFVNRFPDEYVDLVVDPGYRPDLRTFARDYLRLNPSRNRELDLYPLLAHAVPDVLAEGPRDPHVRPRPTWHWRLPDSRVGVPGWSVVPDWNRWVQVERLATDRWAMAELGALWADCRRAGATQDWPHLVARWLSP